jgi:hypothetical protein
MKKHVVMLAFVCMLAGGAVAAGELPLMAIHIEEHADRACDYNLPVLDERSINTTYDGVGKIDAFVVLTRFREAKAISFGLTWPEAWGGGSWHDCSYLKIADITSPGDVTSILWEKCKYDTVPLIVGWLTVTVTTPGAIEIIASHKQGAVALGDCNDIVPSMSEIVLMANGGAGGVKGDDIAEIAAIKNRNWYVRADSTGDMPTIDETIRKAMPGDTVLVEAGTYSENLALRNGVVVLGSWDSDFKKRDLVATPSIVDAAGHHSAVRVMFGEDSTAVLDGFVITGGAGKSGAGIALTNSSSPILRNLIIHSNSATFGGAMSCRSSSPSIENVLIAGNRANSGGGVFCTSGASPHMINVTFAGNHAGRGAAIYASDGSSPYVERSIIADHPDGYGVFTADGSSCISLMCCDLWSNEPADFGGSAKQPVVLRDNISEDPKFVDPSNMDYSVSTGSPALEVEGCGRIGAKHAEVAEP